MTGDNRVWVNKTTGSPKVKGALEISVSQDGVFIGGDPNGLRSLAELLVWLANVDQRSLRSMPNGERCHVHLHAGEPVESFNSLTPFSLETEICRLDAKGTGKFPPKYYGGSDAPVGEHPLADGFALTKPEKKKGKKKRTAGRKRG